MEAEPTAVLSLAGRPVTAYALCLAAALGCALGFLYARCKKQGLKPGTAGTAALLALPLGLICARLFYVTVRFYFFQEIGFEHALRLWEGGYAIWGAIGGCALAALLCARITRQPAARIMDAFAAPAALAIALCRFAEYFSGEGVGRYVESPALQFFPVAVCNEWGEWYQAVFMLEGAVSLAILFAVLRCRRQEGDAARLFCILYCATQVLCESLRKDQYLVWSFVRVSQLTCALVLAGMMLIATLRGAGKLPGGARRSVHWSLWAVFAACIGVVIAMEFAADKAQHLPVWLCYVLMACACVGLGVTGCRAVLPARSILNKGDAGK